ncbi:DUF3027 domain-containing protein [Jonesia denitrificans]|uniref:DUF3027 domain-containing protein n=1 Tax=Jonesia denitrificans (strain ATCC 14870 / DSM 20603 / BCRC 15368 / CIP 55.134 / JCM 11481 / NBRC 15587 / NCTC 10816 / Prevot 55134) TaxID=471856 RepID=C7R0M0_JONDD|nr:DUF3027 domain-containing protein [Jonesia denitrificans]ACV09684.1 hypothetical protein Jden_2046 [Jonesia denitrificans DSM 20603]ASE09100.1 DUF3027 domain-containing protein [Jonesia denitrificans]QXB43644.1 DUF3027 domain-containing protein [Jonesia denitrificans]SQH22217.1 Protein of uncharacterised function (DUF3027) [Jonesia denitrificans]
MTPPPAPRKPRAPRQDAILAQSVELARDAAVHAADHPDDVGDFAGLVMEGERLAALQFAATMRGYVGWNWTVVLARAPRARTATVCEVTLLPGEGALLPPAWLPWADRLQPGDIGPGDVLPFVEGDPRLTPGYTPTGNEDEDRVAIEELALARARVLSEDGRAQAAERWYRGEQGPRSAGSLQSAAGCGSCGFLIPLQGTLGQVFGVCANEWSPDDGRVVALGHGCGAHSETDVPHRVSEWPANAPLIDEESIEQVTTS